MYLAYSLYLLHLSILLSFLVRSKNSSRSLFPPWVLWNKEVLCPLWQPMRVRQETTRCSWNLPSHRDRKLPRMPGSCQKNLQLWWMQIQPVLFQWGLPANSAGEIRGKLSSCLTYIWWYLAMQMLRTAPMYNIVLWVAHCIFNSNWITQTSLLCTVLFPNKYWE